MSVRGCGLWHVKPKNLNSHSVNVLISQINMDNSVIPDYGNECQRLTIIYLIVF